MQGGITARPLDYFGLLVAASVIALVSGVVATLCVKFEERRPAWFWAASFFGSVLVGAYCLGKLVGRAKSLFTPVLTDYTAKGESLVEGGIMVRCKQKCVEKRRECGGGRSTWRDGRKRTQRYDSVEHHEVSEPAA